MGLRHTQRHVSAANVFLSRPAFIAFLILQSCKKPVELPALEIKLGQLPHHVELVIQLTGPVKGPPVHLDRFVRLILTGQRLGQPEHDTAFGRVGANRPAQGVQALLEASQVEAKLRKEFVVFRAAR